MQLYNLMYLFTYLKILSLSIFLYFSLLYSEFDDAYKGILFYSSTMLPSLFDSSEPYDSSSKYSD